MSTVAIRGLRAADMDAAWAIINEAAQAYRGVIPADRWHEPYMPRDELEREIADGVVFWVAEEGERLLGVMGIQDRGEVALVRHAYTATNMQRKGVGTRLLHHVVGLTAKPILIGTWADASWAIDFYRRNGFTVVSNSDKDLLLGRYWSIPARQVATSVVLADGRWMEARQVHTELLFSYGTLQLEAVQMATFGRRLAGAGDALRGFELAALKIEAPEVIAISGKALHTMACYTGRASDVIPGMVFAVTSDEIQSADKYEVAAVKRVAVVLQSGARAWVYVDARRAPSESEPAAKPSTR